ncbi:MAG TPA: phytoene/squalene synthase family protein [Pseudomonadales bacterium]|nr:phytoene/squalene synthase family protein [Pseudomonadales bacterium]
MQAQSPDLTRPARRASRLAGTDIAADVELCRDMLRRGSRSFYLASFLLPARVSGAAAALYAFCRLVDDAIDVQERAPDALPRLFERLERAYAGTPLDHPVDRAFAVTVAEEQIPEALPRALLEGMSWDAEGRGCETLSDVYAYSARVAASVGAMMSVVMGRRAPLTVARACDLGVAMQLSNIARDVGEDARLGRLYLPRVWLRDVGIDPQAWLAEPRFTPELGSVVLRLLKESELLYARATAGIVDLPASCRPGIHAARLIYAEIGRVVEARGGDSVASRAVVSTGRKLALIPRALVDAARGAPPSDAPPLEETRFLVDAVSPPPGSSGDGAGDGGQGRQAP